MAIFWYLSVYYPVYSINLEFSCSSFVMLYNVKFYEYALITLTIYSVLQLSNGMEQLTMANSLQPTDHGQLTMGQLAMVNISQDNSLQDHLTI